MYTSCVLWVAPLYFFFNIHYLSKKIIGAICAKRMGSLWAIIFFIVRLLVPFGMFPSESI
jgi:hypothetical protein